MLQRTQKATLARAALLTACPLGSTLQFMDMDEYLPKKTGDILADLKRQDLDPLSVSELEARVEALQAEIARTKAKIGQAVGHKATAEALFRK